MTLEALSNLGHVEGLEEFWWQDGGAHTPNATRSPLQVQRSLRAGGLVVGLLTEDTTTSGPQPADHDPDWCWIACVMSSKDLFVYVNEFGLTEEHRMLENYNDDKVNQLCGVACTVTDASLTSVASDDLTEQ